MPKMTIEQFKHKVDGLLNDLHDAFIDEYQQDGSWEHAITCPHFE